MVVENGPCSRKSLPSVEKTEHLLWSTPWIHTPDNRNEGQLQGDCIPSPARLRLLTAFLQPPPSLTCPRWQDATSEGGAVVQRLGDE